MDKDSLTLADIRIDYELGKLDIDDCLPNPIDQLNHWLDIAIKKPCLEATAMCLATQDASGFPNTRIVLLKGVVEGKLLFFTNYHSAKGQDISHSEQVCANFFWPELQRQIRVKGIVEKCSNQTSDEYFDSRPVENRISAIVSPQSQKVEHRAYLEQKRAAYVSNQSTENLVRPDYWGGYQIRPVYFEFWQGRQSRLHDRICYELNENSLDWQFSRLAP